ncbi:MAG: Nucleoside triphosphate pyrophosphohydrolase [Chlamydiae bacterium]|nr:Nucleoside triphosphate pyrophosphohydrolase [Chlamydiota bacterium]
MNRDAADAFFKILELSDQLMGSDGCPWDREQTLVSMRESVLEEACEVIEAIDEGDDGHLVEELGDLLYNVIFFCKMAEKERRFETKDPIETMHDKLVYRHPHVFGETQIESAEAVKEQWERLKAAKREKLTDGLPKGMPALLRAYKTAGKIKPSEHQETTAFANEEELGELLWEMVLQARKLGLNPEMALRSQLVKIDSSEI